MITVFYDGKCGLCTKEINYYRRIAPAKRFDWQDITESCEQLNRHGITLVEGLKRLHALDEQGQLYIGANAFILIWQQLPRWKILAVIVALPLIRQLAQCCYAVFADWKFKHSPYCQLAVKEDNSS